MASEIAGRLANGGHPLGLRGGGTSFRIETGYRLELPPYLQGPHGLPGRRLTLHDDGDLEVVAGYAADPGSGAMVPVAEIATRQARALDEDEQGRAAGVAGTTAGRDVLRDFLVAGAFPWLAGVNPLRGQGAGLAANCVLAAIAVEWSLRDGTAHQAGGSDPEPASSLEAFAGQRPWFTVAGPGAVAEAMAAAPEWARGLVVTWEAGDGGPGHAFNVVRHPRLGVVFLDGQAGREAVFPPGQRLVRFAPMTDGIPGPATVPGGPGPGGPVPLGAMTSHLAGTGEPGGTAAGLPGGGGPARAWRDLLGPSSPCGT